jgi:hypothetical protein
MNNNNNIQQNREDDMERGSTARLIREHVRQIAAEEIEKEVQDFVRSRYSWKRRSEIIETCSKVLTATGSILAFAASSIRDPRISDILAFTSGAVGTTGLVLLTLSFYAAKESQERTTEVNNLLQTIGVTPLPQLSAGEGPPRRTASSV